MKNLVFTIAIATLTITSCSKDESFDSSTNQSNDLVYVIDANDPSGSFDSITSENMTRGPIESDNMFGETSGLYEPIFEEPILLTWNGLQDDYGIYGTAELQIIKPAYTLHIRMQTECVSTAGNKAVYGGIITEVIQLSGIAPPLEPSWKFYFMVHDQNNTMGDGNNNDKISNKWIFASPNYESLCSVYTPNHSIWFANGLKTVYEPGFVNVSDHPQ